MNTARTLALVDVKWGETMLVNPMFMRVRYAPKAKVAESDFYNRCVTWRLHIMAITAKGAKSLVVGDKLKWDHDIIGKVVEIGYAGFKVQWDDPGQTFSTFLFRDPNDRFEHLTYMVRE